MEHKEPYRRLFAHLFEDADPQMALTYVSEGVGAIIKNVSRLLSDVELLVNAKRFASAAFLLATAKEEIAKSYILLDASRVDITKHKNVLKGLCRGFYDHVIKHAYTSILWFQRVHDMAHAKEIWDCEVKRWWPGHPNPEYAEPDLPHIITYLRETPLYVDFNYISHQWVVPTPSTRREAFEGIGEQTEMSESQLEFKRLYLTGEAGLYHCNALLIINDIFRKEYVKEDTPNKVLENLYKKAADTFEAHMNVSKDIFYKSSLHQWPLYHFATTRQ